MRLQLTLIEMCGATNNCAARMSLTLTLHPHWVQGWPLPKEAVKNETQRGFHIYSKSPPDFSALAPSGEFFLRRGH